MVLSAADFDSYTRGVSEIKYALLHVVEDRTACQTSLVAISEQ